MQSYVRLKLIIDFLRAISNQKDEYFTKGFIDDPRKRHSMQIKKMSISEEESERNMRKGREKGKEN